ncbi:MAG: redox-regulated ATPase YchF [Candidatus Sumerlaeaceae bacterium]|nr:redox-regulated ATPase YchF [Candidatus Sumerlaeaceae bacterium]
MELALIGLAKSGKTTVFNALTGGKAQTSAFAGGKLEPNIAVVKVPDPRVDKLAEIYQPKKVTHATVKYVDVAGMAREEDSPEKGVPEALLQYVSRADALIAVIRGFEDAIHGLPKISHDVETVHLELVFSDLAKVENRLNKLEKTLPKLSGREKEVQHFEFEVLRKIQPLLQENKPIRAAGLSHEEEKAIRGFQFLTAKPIMYLLNVGESELARGDELVRQLNVTGITDQPRTTTAWLAGELEMEIAQLEGEDRAAFLRDYKIERPAAERIIALSYELLGYISFLPVGPVEVRAWTTPAGTQAPQAAGTIHSDFERGFIRAEVVPYDELIRQGGSFANAKKHGLCRLEGKNYVVHDGDVINFLFSV